MSLGRGLFPSLICYTFMETKENVHTTDKGISLLIDYSLHLCTEYVIHYLICFVKQQPGT